MHKFVYEENFLDDGDDDKDDSDDDQDDAKITM
jgi:hypothetical protein